MWGCLQYLFAFFTKLCSFIPFFYFIYVAHQRSALALRISTSLIIFCIQFVIMEENKSLFWEIAQILFYADACNTRKRSCVRFYNFFVFNNQSFNLNIQWTSNCMYLMAFFFFVHYLLSEIVLYVIAILYYLHHLLTYLSCVLYTFRYCARSSFSRHHPTLALKQIKINPRASLDANQQKAKLNKQSKRTELFGDPFLLCYIGRDLVGFFVFVSVKSTMFRWFCCWTSPHKRLRFFWARIVIAIGFGKNAKSSKWHDFIFKGCAQLKNLIYLF